MATVLRFLFVVPLAYVAACLAAAFAMLWPFVHLGSGAAFDPLFIGETTFYLGAQAVQIGAVAFLPWVIFMVASEILVLPSLLLHLLAGFLGGIAILFSAYGPNVPHMSVQTAILVASLTFALVYWILAGNGAGRWRRAAARSRSRRHSSLSDEPAPAANVDVP
ncbi:hypothetical protein LQ948_01590 [Jiella sp. MQZ9-1]|uniref:Uncharacterized protein n=1 Tax=Jiella flava TaxID=2816857 RepID=A0A939FSS8_9HYPH|nr:hypothetical protein [Jiella flava]MBO0661253.1 hypothetical protein [Jiella flava]MCD2469898.1 hypothetical protein [Jiella flava]